MDTVLHTVAPRRRRVLATGAGALSVSIAALGIPGVALAAQGDNDIVIDVIDQVKPAVVTIQTPATSLTVTSQDDRSGDSQTPEDPSTPQNPDDLQDLLPEGFQLPDGMQLPDDLFGQGFGFDVPPDGFDVGGSGSGVIISADGLILTNGHVVGDAETVDVILDDGTTLEGTVSGVDTLTDFAFVQVDASGLPSVSLGDSSDLRVGQLAIAIGNPLGGFPGSAAVGIVSGLDRSIDVFGMGGGERLNHLIQTDAAINSGNSGGALFDGDGELIGITTAKAGINDGMGFALPVDLAKPIIEQALAGETLSRPYVGVVYTAVDAQLAEEEGLSVTDGAWIGGGDPETDPVVAGSPADEAGLKAGDIITAVDGVAVDRINPLDLQVLRFAPGDEVTLDVLRGDEQLTLKATLGTRPADLNG